MRKYKRKVKLNIALILVLAMMIQIVVPPIPKTAFAEGDIEAGVTDEIQEEEGEVEGKEAETTETHEVEENEPETNDQEGRENPEDDPKATVNSKSGEVGSFNVGVQGDLGNIFTFESLKIDNDDIDDGDIITIKEGTTAQLRFNWNTEGLGAKEGDTAEIPLSDAFKMVTTRSQEIIVEGVHVGDFNVENGILKFVFNENIEKDDVNNGYVNLGLEFNLEKFKENIEQEIPFHDGSDQNITVIARPNLEHSGIKKEGHPDNSHDAREITWTIDVINTNDKEITAASVKDIIPEGLGEARDFVIHEISVGYDGDKRVGDKVELESLGDLTIDSEGFKLDLGDIAPFKGYQIKYKTTITDYSKDTFTNKAAFEYDEKSIPAEATVGGLTRSNPIEKKGWQIGKTDEIQWQIEVNKNGLEIDNAIVYDTLPDGLEIIEGSIEVLKNGELVSVETINFPVDPITLGKVEATDVYRINFRTSIDYSKINNGEYQVNNGFLNETTLNNGDIEIGDDDATVTIERDPILEKVGVSNVNYKDKTLTWTIHVNEAGHNIGNVVLTDLIPEGLSIEEKDIDITDEEGKSYNPSSIKLNPKTQGGTEVVINLGDVGTRQLKIEYKTEIINFNLNSFNNGVGIAGDGIGAEGNTSNATISPEGNTFNKNVSGIDYKEKTMDWRISVNPVREAITKLEIEDSFPNKGMILLADTLVVKAPVYNAETGQYESKTLELDKDYTLDPRTEEGETGYHKGFKITLKDTVLPLDNGQLVITYKTSYDPDKEVDGNKLDAHIRSGEQDRVYINCAHFTGETINGNAINQTCDANTTVRQDSWNSGKKEGQLVHFDNEGNEVNGWVSGAERKIAWQFYINYQEQNLGSDVLVTDKLAYAGFIDADSVQVSVYEVNPDGTTKITDNVLDPDGYNLTVNGDEFTIEFKETVNERYVIEFTTSVPNIALPSYTNNAKVTAGGKEYPYSSTLQYKKHNRFLDKNAVNLEGNRVFTGDEVDWKVTVNESLSIIKNAVITDTISAGHVYVGDSLEIFKLAGIEEIPLTEGTDYTLDTRITEDDENVLTIIFLDKLVDTLILRYKTVVTKTEGQVNNAISLDGKDIEAKSVESEKLTARQFASVGGEWAANRGALRVRKVDTEENDVIANNETTFELWYNLNGERVQYTQVDGGDNVIPFTTDKGVLEIGNLPFRTYYLKEVKAPTGYLLSKEEIEINVDKAYDENDENVVKADFKNIKEKVNIKGRKEWINGENNRPESIQLQLYRDGVEYRAPVTLAADTTEYTWKDLDKTDINGTEYKYTVDEVEVPQNYKKDIAEDGLTITNTYEIPRAGEAKATKEWVNGPEEKPTVWFELYRTIEDQDPEVVPDVEIKELANGMIKVEWTDLEETDSNGNYYIFLVKEVDKEGNDFTPEYYKKTEDGLKVTNTYVSPKIDVTGAKKWINGENNRPESIQLQLYRNGEAYLEPVTLETEDTEYTWKDLDKTDINGKNYTYTVDEVKVPRNYKKDIADDSLTIINTYQIPTSGEAKATKEWVGGPETKPTVWFELYRQIESGEPEAVPHAEIKELSEGVTEVKWIGLEETDINGNAYIFSVKEVDSDGNDFTPEHYKKVEEGLTVTNTYIIPADASAKATKEWEDGPVDKPTVWFKLYRQVEGGDLEPVPEAEIKKLANGTTEVEWTDLDRTDSNGNIYIFSVKEVDAKGNDFTPTNYVKIENGLVVTNFYVSPTDAYAKAIKIWENGPKERPTIWFELYRQIEGGELEKVPAGEADILSLKSGITEVVWTELTKTDSLGNDYIFSVKEVDEKGYDFQPENYIKAEEGLTVTNTYVIPVIEVVASKDWEGGPDEKPSIELQLYRNGEKFGDPVKLDGREKEAWTYTWTDLKKTDIDGNEYVYTVDEVEVPENYKKTLSEDGLTVTNTYEDPTDPSDVGGSNIDKDKEDKLPQTGESSKVPFYIGGALLIAIGFYFRKRRRA